MWKQLLAFVVLTSLLACASVTKTGIVNGDTFTDSHYNTQITKNKMWDFYVPPEEEGINPWRFSLYRSAVGHKDGWKWTYVGRDSATGQTIYRSRRDGIRTVESSAEAQFRIIPTNLDLAAFRDSIKAIDKDCELVGNFHLGDYGKGYHLTRTEEPYGDCYFTIRDGKAYVVEYFAGGLNDYRRWREELEKMLTSITCQ